MKIGILTYYGVHNHGAVLQANALKTYLMNKGHEVTFLSFERNYDFIPKDKAKKYLGGFSSIIFYTKYLFEKGIANILFNYKKKRILDYYRKINIPLGVHFDKFVGDLVIIGSDEVFSLEIGFNPSLYGIGVKSKNKVSYAGSFGPTSLEDIYSKGLAERISNGLNELQDISVRDKNSQDIVKKLTGRDASLVCDPVIMYGYENEMKSFIPRDKGYIVLYAYDRSMQDRNEINEILNFAKKHNKKVYSVGYHHDWCDRNIQATPVELLGWIKNADCVITDTFHGTVLSIICNTPMIVKLRENANKLAFLLDEYSLNSRMIIDFNELEKVYNIKIDFDCLNRHVQERRAFSRAYIDSILKG